MSITYNEVKQILNDLADQGSQGHPFHDGKGRFWNDYDTLVSTSTKIYDQQPVVVVGNPDASPLIKALKGEAPFDDSSYPRMPQDRPPATTQQINDISDWIRNGCPRGQALADGGEDEAASY